MRHLMIAAILAIGGAFLGASPATADDTQCVVAPVGGEPLTETYDNIVVPEGALCVLIGAEVRGNVLALPGSTLFIGAELDEDGEIVERSAIHGNVEAKEDVSTTIVDSFVGGNYKCDKCFFEDAIANEIVGNVEIVGAQDGDFILFNQIGGSIVIVESEVVLRPEGPNFGFIVEDNDVGGNVILEKNSGPMSVGANEIAGELKFAENDVRFAFCPPPPPPQNPEDPCEVVFEGGLIETNTIGGNVQVIKNVGPIAINDNVIEQSLQCFDNDPPATSAGNVAEKFEGECRA